MKLSMKIVIHGIYWVVFSMFSMVVGYGKLLSEWKYINNLTPHFILNLLWAGIIFYLFYFYFIQFIEKKQFLRYLMYSLLLSMVLTMLMLPLHRFFFPQFDILNAMYLVPPIAGTFIIAQCGSLIRGFENWFADIKLKAELKASNLSNELEVLKSQINPHFLFNALNNIDSLIHTNPHIASDSLIRLSSMLRYMIYETRNDLVSLDKELDYIRSYIQLQQLRYHEKKYVAYILPDSACGLKVAPMMLIPFIENAFKYAHISGKLPVISISLSCDHEMLSFSCKNYCHYSSDNIELCGGVGLDNVKRRLELLYRDRHELSIVRNDTSFEVNLRIMIS